MNSVSPSAVSQVHILSRAFDNWVVEFRLDVGELLDQQQILQHLRAVKQAIAVQQSVPESTLVFDGIVRKSKGERWMDVVVRMKKKMIAKGNPKIIFEEEKGSDGTVYSHMRALLSFYYFDEFERVITLDRVLQTIRLARIIPRLVDEDIVSQKVREVLESQMPCLNIPIAEGSLPENGAAAEIEFFFQAVADTRDIDTLYSSRRVSPGDLLCRKTSPSEGRRDGINVLGQVLPAQPGQDIALEADQSTSLSLDALEIVAETDGVAVVSRRACAVNMLGGTKRIPEAVTVKVNPILKLDGNDVVDMTTSQAVEITGNLKVGSRIVTDSEVFISGGVEQGASITASDDIIVKGDIFGATLSSQRNIVTGSGVKDSILAAQGDVKIGGDVSHSTVVGDSVEAQSATGSKILGRKGVTMQRIEADENNILSTICVGMNDFFMQRLKENQQFVESATANLERIKLVLGADIFDQVAATNVQTMLMRLLSQLRIETNPQTRQQIDVYRKLLEAIPPTRALIEQKERESLELANKLLDQNENAENVIIIRERIATKVSATVNGVQGIISASDQPARITRNGRQLSVTSPAPNTGEGARGS